MSLIAKNYIFINLGEKDGNNLEAFCAGSKAR